MHNILKSAPRRRRKLDVLYKLRVEEGESGELVLVQIHHEELVRGSEIRLLRGELPVKVGHVLPMALRRSKDDGVKGATSTAAAKEEGLGLACAKSCACLARYGSVPGAL